MFHRLLKLSRYKMELVILPTPNLYSHFMKANGTKVKESGWGEREGGVLRNW